MPLQSGKRFHWSTPITQYNCVSYSIDTVKRISAMQPETQLYWVMGVDQWNLLPDWRGTNQLMKLLTFIVFGRGERPKTHESAIMTYLERQIDISSTEIRERIQAGKSIRHMVPDVIDDYIQENGIYQHD
ncbi:MAG: hypothetical protein AAFY98_05945 [Verrucomicrobiota bacterium]